MKVSISNPPAPRGTVSLSSKGCMKNCRAFECMCWLDTWYRSMYSTSYGCALAQRYPLLLQQLFSSGCMTPCRHNHACQQGPPHTADARLLSTVLPVTARIFSCYRSPAFQQQNMSRGPPVARETSSSQIKQGHTFNAGRVLCASENDNRQTGAAGGPGHPGGQA